MPVEEVFEGTNLEHLHHLPRFKEIKETVWRGLTLQEFKLPSVSLPSRILFMARMILEPVKSLWNLCLFYLFLVNPEDCPVCANLKKQRKKPHIVLRCPRCKLPAHTSGTNGRNPVLNCPKHGRLSVMRSIEARCFFALCAVRVGQLVAAGLSQKKTVKLLGVSGLELCFVFVYFFGVVNGSPSILFSSFIDSPLEFVQRSPAALLQPAPPPSGLEFCFVFCVF